MNFRQSIFILLYCGKSFVRNGREQRGLDLDLRHLVQRYNKIIPY